MRTSMSIAALAAFAGLAQAAAPGRGEPLVRPGQHLSPERAAGLTGEDAVNVYQLRREDCVKLGDGRVKVPLDAALITSAPPAIDKRNFRAPDLTDAAEDAVMVRFKPGATGEEQAVAHLRAGGLRVVWESSTVPGLCQVEGYGIDVAGTVETYLDEEAVLYATPLMSFRKLTTPNDVGYASQWNMYEAGWGCHAEGAWDQRTSSSSLIVAVVDSGIDYSHPDLLQNIWVNTDEIPGNGIDDDHNGFVDDRQGWDFFDNRSDPAPTCDDHGTLVAGVIGAQGNNVLGVAGVCWTAKLMNLCCEDPASPCSNVRGVERATDYAVANGARLSNHSYAGTSFYQPLYDSMLAAQAAGHLLTCGAGNAGSNNDVSPQYPASYGLDNIISVAWTNSDGTLDSQSCYGATSVDLAAPGGQIYTTTLGSAYDSASGTSLAAPHVAGAAALLLAENPTMTFGEAKARLLNSVTTRSALSTKCVSGGILNVQRALGVWCNPAGVPGGTGARGRPLNNIELAWQNTPVAGVLNLYPGSGTPVTRVLNKAMTIRAPFPGGDATIR